MGTLAIETRGLKKSFGTTHAVAGVDLAVSAGGVYGVLGPNGAGKTTTIRMLATLLHPDAGEAQVLGHRDTAVRDHDRLAPMHERLQKVPHALEPAPRVPKAQAGAPAAGVAVQLVSHQAQLFGQPGSVTSQSSATDTRGPPPADLTSSQAMSTTRTAPRSGRTSGSSWPAGSAKSSVSLARG